MTLELTKSSSPDDLVSENNYFSQFWRNLFSKANELSVSDIHVESLRQGLVIRFRIHGKIFRQETIEDRYDAVAIVDKLKEISKLRLTDKSSLQDSSFRLSHTKSTYRISLSPGYEFGECAVLRIIRDDDIPTLEKLKLAPNVLADLSLALSQKQGLILVTGPTGSGKSTTLQACIGSIDRSSKKVISIEDPPERIIPDAIHEKITHSYNWTSAIKGAMRQDPDVILIGEIRDKESAKLAMEAAQTGHLVLSTLHANDVPSTVNRLMILGVEKYLIADSLLLVSAQRLLQKLCEECKIKDDLGCRKGEKSCFNCHNIGYSGRIPILEYCIKPHSDLIYNFNQIEFTKILRQTLIAETTKLVIEGLVDYRVLNSFKEGDLC